MVAVSPARRRRAWALFILGLLLSPITLLGGCLACNVVNGFNLAFQASFTVTNGLSVPVEITPIGIPHGRHERALLPMMLPTIPLTISNPQRCRFAIGPGESRTLHYDMDDINFTEILVESADGRSMLPVRAPVTATQPARRVSSVRITSEHLVPVTPEVDRVELKNLGWRHQGTFIVAALVSYLILRAGRRGVRRIGRHDAGDQAEALDAEGDSD